MNMNVDYNIDTTLTKKDIDDFLGARLKYKNRTIWIVIIGIFIVILLFVFLIVTGYIKLSDPVKGVNITNNTAATQ
jgi:hypothetical protein